MTKSTYVRTRVEPELKKSIERILDSLGLTMSEAIYLYLKQIELYKGLPFDVRLPNDATLAAIKDIQENQRLKTFDSVEDLIKDLES